MNAAELSVRRKNTGALRLMVKQLPLDIVIWKNARNWEQAKRASNMLENAAAELRRRKEAIDARVKKLPTLIAARLADAPESPTRLAMALKMEREFVLTALRGMAEAGEVIRAPSGRYELLRTRKAA